MKATYNEKKNQLTIIAVSKAEQDELKKLATTLHLGDICKFDWWVCMAITGYEIIVYMSGAIKRRLRRDLQFSRVSGDAKSASDNTIDALSRFISDNSEELDPFNVIYDGSKSNKNCPIALIFSVK